MHRLPTQTNQSVGIYGSSQTYGQSSSSTVDASEAALESLADRGVLTGGSSAGGPSRLRAAIRAIQG